jgi:hypothetical protein
LSGNLISGELVLGSGQGGVAGGSEQRIRYDELDGRAGVLDT